jgi:GcrA cell cycle regulator
MMETDRRSQPWTLERERQLRELWPGKLSVGQIARKLGVTKNAVAGKRLRLGLPRRAEPRGGWRVRHLRRVEAIAKRLAAAKAGTP